MQTSAFQGSSWLPSPFLWSRIDVIHITARAENSKSEKLKVQGPVRKKTDVLVLVAFLRVQKTSRLTAEVQLNRTCHWSLKAGRVFHLQTCLFVQMEFGQPFAPSDFQKILFFILLEFLRRYLPRLSIWVSLATFDPSENNHGWNSKKHCATLFFSIRSLEITSILECGFSPFPSLFDLLSRRNNTFFFWNRSCASQYIGTSVKCTGLLLNNVFFWKGNCTESLLKSLANHAITAQEFVLLFTRCLQPSIDWSHFSALLLGGSVGYSIPIPLLQQRQPSTPAPSKPPFTASLTAKSPAPPPAPWPPSAHARTMLPTSPGTIWGTNPPPTTPSLQLGSSAATVNPKSQTLQWAGGAAPPASISVSLPCCSSWSLLFTSKFDESREGRPGEEGTAKESPYGCLHLLLAGISWLLHPRRAPLLHVGTLAEATTSPSLGGSTRSPSAWAPPTTATRTSAPSGLRKTPPALRSSFPASSTSCQTHSSSLLSSCVCGNLFPESNGRKK